MKSRVIFAVCVGLLLGGFVQSAELEPRLKGNWTGSCRAWTENDLGKSFQVWVHFYNERSLDYVKQVFSDETCQALVQEIRWGATAMTPRKGEIDFTLDSVTITPRTAKKANLLAKSGYCGTSDWKVNQPQQVAGVECGKDQFGPAGFKAINIYDVNSFKLKLDFDRSVPAFVDRPTKLGNESVETYRVR